MTTHFGLAQTASREVIETFKWRDRMGTFTAPKDMPTRHLFFTLRMIWNNTMPAAARQPGNLYTFPKFYTRNYMLTAVHQLARELATRTDMTAEWSVQLAAMVEYLKRAQISYTFTTHERLLQRE